MTNGAGMPAHTRARALFVAGTLANGQADYRSAAALLEESLELFRGLEDKLGAAYVLSSAGFAAIGQAQHEKGIALLEEAVGLSLEVGEKWGAAYMLCFLATVWRSRGNHGRAKRLAERALALSREAGDKQGISIALYLLAGLAQVERDHEQATRLFEEGLELSTEVGDETNVAYCLEGLATVAALEGKVVRAARLWGTAEAILSRIEVAGYIYAPDRTLYQSQAVAAREALGEEAFKAVWAEGRTMTSEEAVEYALSKEEPTPTTIAALPGRPSVDNLTRREEEVAVLVAQGLTNRRIASELTLSKRTVDNHVRNILKKLKLPSRAHVAVWVKQPRHEVGPVQES